jgi:hypothetical protein
MACESGIGYTLAVASPIRSGIMKIFIDTADIQMFNHPPTEKGLAVFVADWAKTGQSIL